MDLDKRLAKLDEINRRCDGNDRFCTRVAVRSLTLIPADGNGNPKPDAQPVNKTCCEWHRKQFERSGFYCVQKSVPLVKGERGPRGSTAITFAAA